MGFQDRDYVRNRPLDYSIICIMRCLPLEIPERLIKQSELYAPGHAGSDAVCHVLEDYPRLVGDIRKLRSELVDFNRESADFDERLQALQKACRAILDL